MIEPCGIVTCPALAVADGLCSVHAGAKRASAVMVGTKCPACGRTVERGDWITRDSTPDSMRHVHCVPLAPWRGRKRDRIKPLLDAAAAEDA